MQVFFFYKTTITYTSRPIHNVSAPNTNTNTNEIHFSNTNKIHFSIQMKYIFQIQMKYKYISVRIQCLFCFRLKCVSFFSTAKRKIISSSNRWSNRQHLSNPTILPAILKITNNTKWRKESLKLNFDDGICCILSNTSPNPIKYKYKYKYYTK